MNNRNGYAGARALRFLKYLVAMLSLAGMAGVVLHQHRDLQAGRARLAGWQPEAIEIGFAQFMSLHHQQAIDMAQLLQDGRPSRLLLLARGIEGAQQFELGEMRGWLRLWQQPLLPATRSMDWMLTGDAPPGEALDRYLLDCRRSPDGMPGLASADDLDRLRMLAGSARDRHFLSLMLAHHRGGEPMARFAAEQAGLAAVRELATRVVVGQAEEINRIEQMLQALPAADE